VKPEETNVLSVLAGNFIGRVMRTGRGI
jgi:hypothetical protein